MHNRGYHVFSSKVFSLILPKNSVEDPSLSEKSSGFEKNFSMRGISSFLVRRGGGVAQFSVDYFFLRVPKFV